MLSNSAHIFWEAAAIFAGLFLAIDGFYTLKKVKDKLQRNLAVIRILIGIGTIIVDATFLASWL